MLTISPVREPGSFSNLVKKAGDRVIAAEDCFVHHFGKASGARLAPDLRSEQAVF